MQKLDTAELLAMVPCAAESVLRRGRAVMELGRRAADDPALLTEVAALIRDPANRRLITIGPVSVSQQGTAGLVAADAEPTTALARELAAEWPPGDQSDFARLMTSSGAARPAAWPAAWRLTRPTSGGRLRRRRPGRNRPGESPVQRQSLRPDASWHRGQVTVAGSPARHLSRVPAFTPAPERGRRPVGLGKAARGRRRGDYLVVSRRYCRLRPGSAR